MTCVERFGNMGFYLLQRSSSLPVIIVTGIRVVHKSLKNFEKKNLWRPGKASRTPDFVWNKLPNYTAKVLYL